jgi:hypothetical protein
MKVQELINRLADFRADAEVVFWEHNESDDTEYTMPVSHVSTMELWVSTGVRMAKPVLLLKFL